MCELIEVFVCKKNCNNCTENINRYCTNIVAREGICPEFVHFWTTQQPIAENSNSDNSKPHFFTNLLPSLSRLAQRHVK
jgi:hypothetical protein